MRRHANAVADQPLSQVTRICIRSSSHVINDTTLASMNHILTHLKNDAFA